MEKAEWVDRFITHLSKLEVRADPVSVGEMADELYEAYQLSGELAPEEAAQAEYDEWPPLDV